MSPFAVDFFAYPLRSVNGAPDSAGEAPGCPESPRQDPPTGAARGPTRSSAAGPEHDGYDVHAHLVDQARGKHLATDAGPVPLELIRARPFQSGNVLLYYRPRI